MQTGFPEERWHSLDYLLYNTRNRDTRAVMLIEQVGDNDAEDRIIGCILCQNLKDKKGLFIDFILVDPHYEGKGVSQFLV